MDEGKRFGNDKIGTGKDSLEGPSTIVRARE